MQAEEAGPVLTRLMSCQLVGPLGSRIDILDHRLLQILELRQGFPAVTVERRCVPPW